MAPGPPNLGDNRFAPLLTLSPPRKKRNITGYHFEYPELPTPNHDNPKYILASTLEGEKKLASYSCFAINKSLHAIDQGILSISTLRDGNLLMLVKSQIIADKFIKRNDLPGICKIKFKLHDTLNSTKGSIYAPYQNEISEEEIVKELSPQGVTGVHKFKKIIDGTPKYTGAILLTFNLYTLPPKINLAWNVAKVREYFPNPMRCQTCQRLGHTAKHCKNSPACVTCSLPPHLPERPCTQIQCINCKLDHEATSRDCPQYLHLKELLKIKTQKKCTIKEAKTFIKNNATTHPNSYAAALTSNNNTNNVTQTIKNTNNITQSIKNTNNSSNNNQEHSENSNASPDYNLKTITNRKNCTSTVTIDTNVNSHKPTQSTHAHTESSSSQTIRNNYATISPNTITSLKKTQNSISYDLSINSPLLNDTNDNNNNQSSDLEITGIEHTQNKQYSNN